MMNTAKSNHFIEEWINHSNPLKRMSVTCQRTFNTTSDRLFSLLCPTTEYDWIPGWRCTLLHSNSGRAEYNAVFKTSFFGLDELWVCTLYEPSRAIEYSRTARDISTKVDICITDNCDGTVTGKWVITASALNENGSKTVAEHDDARQNLEDLLDLLEHYVNTGEMKA